MDELGELAPSNHDDLDGVPPPAASLRVEGHHGQLSELTTALEDERLHHAWLLQGPHGIGKATTAFAFARHVLVGDGAGEAGSTPASSSPSNPIVRQIARGNFPGLLHITRPAAERGGGFRTQITVEEIRRLNRFFQSTVSPTQYRVAIVDPVDDMNRNAANALLKLLEEPPARSLFLLVNHTAGRLLPTIRSRCRLLRFQPLDDPSVSAAVSRALPSAGTETIAAAVAMSRGRVRDALSLIAGGGIEIRRTLDSLMAQDRPDWNAILSVVDSTTSKGREQSYDLAIATVLAAIAETSETMVGTGDGEGASRMARLWYDESRRLREASAYNLDRKQAALTLFDRFYRCRAG